MNNILDIIKKIGLKAYIVVISLTMIIACEICNTENNIIHNISNNTAFIAIIGFIIFIIIAIKSFQKFVDVKKNDKIYNEDKSADDYIDDFCNTEKISIIQKWFLYDYFKDYFNNQITYDNGGADNNELSSKETDIMIKQQMQKAKQNKYNNSYLTFCLLIDRCIEIADNKEQPYCFQEIAEAFGLEWKRRRYVPYIAYSLLGTIGGLLEEYNKKEGNEKIPCVNASVVTKWERDHGNKWFCNGGIKATTWCCYPPYTSKEGEDDRNFILKLCKIVKENEGKITSWKNEYYKLLTEEVKTKNEKIKQDENKFKFVEQDELNKVYENYKENGTKMSYQELEKKKKHKKTTANQIETMTKKTQKKTTTINNKT